MEKVRITLNLDLEEIVTEFLPKLMAQYLQISGAAKELAGTAFTMCVELSGHKFNFLARDGADIMAAAGDAENPMVRVSLSIDDMMRFIEPRNIDMLLGMQSALNRRNYDAMEKLGGTAVFELEFPDGAKIPITAVFNSAPAPKAVFRLSMENAKELLGRRSNPVQMFMNGTLKIDGDIAFAMALQQFFT